jgi:hypothetical protein
MSAYTGPARVIAEEDTEVRVNANLKSGRDGLRTSWGGVLTPTSDGLRRLLNLTTGRLRLSDGAEAEFLRPDTSDWVASQQLTIIGQGDAPF